MAKMNADGADLLMFSYIGGRGTDHGWNMTVDSSYDCIPDELLLMT